MGIENSPKKESEPVSLDDVRKRKDAEFKRLLEQSSLGSPAAKAIRSRTSQELVEQGLARVRKLEGREDAPVLPFKKKRSKRKPSTE